MDKNTEPLYYTRIVTDPFPSLQLHGLPHIYWCEPHWEWRPPAPFADHDLWCVMDGDGSLDLNGRNHHLQAGICFVFHPGDRVHGRQNPDHRLRVFACHFDIDEAAEAGLLPHVTRLHDLPLLSTLARDCEAAAHARDKLAPLRTQLTFRLLLLHLAAQAQGTGDQPGDPLIARLYHAIREDPGQPWTVERLARRANLSHSQLTRRFVAETGMSPIRCVTTARIDRAQRLLRESRLTVSQIADALGYRDVFYFSRQFKQLTGLPPTHRRR